MTAAHAGDEASGGHGHGHGLRETFAERVISLRTMDRGLRAAVAGAIAVLFVAAVFVGLRDIGFKPVQGGRAGEEDVVMPRVIFWLTIALLAVGWTYVLWGLAHAHRLLRVAGLALFSWGMFELWHDALPFGVWRMAPSYALLAAVWVVTLVGGPRRIVLPGLLLLAAGLYLAFWWRLDPYHEPRIYTLLVYHQLGQMSFVLIPLLYVAGVDFAEWGDAVSIRVSETMRGARASVGALAATVAVVGGALGYRAFVLSRQDLAEQLGLGLLFLAAIAVPAFVVARSNAAARVPYAAILTAAAILLVLIVGYSHVLVPSVPKPPKGLQTFVHARGPTFQVDYPEQWERRAIPGQDGLRLFVFGPPGARARFYVFYLPKKIAVRAPDAVATLFQPTSVKRGRDGVWTTTRFPRGKTVQAQGWQRREHGAIWLLVAFTITKKPAVELARYEGMVQTFTTDVKTRADYEAENLRYDDHVLSTAALSWLGVGLVLGAVLLVRRGRSPAPLSTALLFLVVTGLFYFLTTLDRVAHHYGLWRSDVHLRLPGLQLAIGAVTIVWLAWLVARRRVGRSARVIALLLTLNGGMLAVQWMNEALLSGRQEAGRFSIVAAVLVLTALGWDILMSGESVTNRHTTSIPRATRVYLYLGYVMLVATAVLFFSSLTFVSGSTLSEPDFESETFPSSGLLVFGSALLVTLFVVRIGRVLGKSQAGHSGFEDAPALLEE